MRSALAVGIFIALAASRASAEEGVTLKWKFKPGQTSYYTSSQDMKINVKQGIVAQEMLMKQTSDVRWEVESVDDDGNAHVTQTIERIRSESGPAEDTVTFDSKDDQPPKDVDESSIEALRAGINQPVHLVLDPSGKVLDVRLSEQFAQKIKESPQYGPLAMMFSRENLKQMASINTIELPNKPVTKGSTWEQESTLADQVAGKQKLTTTYRYDGAEEHDGRRLEKISASAKISPADEKKLSPVTVKDQKLNGVIWFDRGSGRIDEMQMTIKVASEAVAGANKIEQIMLTKLHTKLVDKPADAQTKPKKSAAKKAEDL
ncbi:MAG: DUF6263 family protein [Pirellulales bacterium]